MVSSSSSDGVPAIVSSSSSSDSGDTTSSDEGDDEDTRTEAAARQLHETQGAAHAAPQASLTKCRRLCAHMHAPRRAGEAMDTLLAGMPVICNCVGGMTPFVYAHDTDLHATLKAEYCNPSPMFTSPMLPECLHSGCSRRPNGNRFLSCCSLCASGKVRTTNGHTPDCDTRNGTPTPPSVWCTCGRATRHHWIRCCHACSGERSGVHTTQCQERQPPRSRLTARCENIVRS